MAFLSGRKLEMHYYLMNGGEERIPICQARTFIILQTEKDLELYFLGNE
jgi:hypothetical protein